MKFKQITLKEFIEYRNLLLKRREQRRKNFGIKLNFYDIKLDTLDNQYPEFSGLGLIKLKKEL